MSHIKRAYLSKSSVLAGCQCPKLLWMRLNQPDAFPPVDVRQQALFDQGHEVGNLAKLLFPDGIEVGGNPRDYRSVVQTTRKLLNERKPLFEAGIFFDGGYARVDILNPVGSNSWEIIEVKSSTSIKTEHITDVAFQKYVCEGAGLTIEKCGLMHINRDYVRNGGLDPAKLLIAKDVTEKVDAAFETVVAEFGRLKGIATEDTCPAVSIGSHCSSPYPCPLKEQCWNFLPEHPVTDLYYSKKKAFGLLLGGTESIADLGESHGLNAKQQIQVEAVRSGEPHIDSPALGDYLSKLEHPVSYLDFETFRSAVPRLDGTRPYQQIPFQYSLHIVDETGSDPHHLGFLAEDDSDRRSEFLEQLVRELPASGSIVVYNASFELGRLRECCDLLPEYREWLAGVEKRIVDLLQPFRSFDYYHPDQHGSASIKAVLPALTGEGYNHLAIQDGDTASLAFLASSMPPVSAEDRNRVRNDLENYCMLDTLGMVHITEKLARIALQSSTA